MRMSPMFSRKFVLVPVLAVLSGCAATNCDPDKTNFYSGLGCTVGNGYSQRTQNLSEKLRENNADAASARASLEQAQAQASAAQESVAQRRAALQKMNTTTAQLKKKLASAIKAHTLSAQQEAQAKAELAAIKANSANPTAANNQKAKESQQRMADILAGA